MERARIAVDMDEVLADSHGRILELYRRDFGIQLLTAQIEGKRLVDAVDPEHRSAVDLYPHDASFFRSLSLIPGSQEVLRPLCDRHEVFIASAAMEYPSSFTAKFEWLRQHFPFLTWDQVVFCGDKSIIHADYLIDDSPTNLSRFSGKGILFSAPHNAHETRFRRVAGWQEIAELFLA